MRTCAKIVMFGLLVFAALLSAAQDTPPVETPQPDAQSPATPDTIFEHSQTAKWWISGQANFIFQANGDFYARYSGTNSFKNVGENALSRVLTLFTAYQFTPNSQVYFDIEESGGSGLSAALGLAGFVNLDVVRNPTIGQAPYIARLFYQQTIPLSDEKIESERTPLSLATEVAVKRLNIRFGKFSMPDFFDYNIGGTDSHYQFMNWVIDNNGAYDYAADTRGYTIGAVVELDTRNWALRFAETLMPKVANGQDLDADVARARSENLELELRPQLFKNKDTTLRLLNYVNHGNMGDYEQAVKLYLDGVTPTPDVSATAKQGTVKYGFGINFEQEFIKDAYVFGRWGWNEGQHDRSATPRTTRASSSASTRAAPTGIATWTAPAQLSSPAACRRRTRLTWPTVVLGFILGDGARITAAKLSRSSSTQLTYGAECSWPPMCSTSTIPA